MRHVIQDQQMKPISRRDMLNQAALLGTAVAVAPPLAQTAAGHSCQKPHEAKPRLKVVGTGGHVQSPDFALPLAS